jgi:hypothetical protein
MKPPVKILVNTRDVLSPKIDPSGLWQYLSMRENLLPFTERRDFLRNPIKTLWSLHDLWFFADHVVR